MNKRKIVRSYHSNNKWKLVSQKTVLNKNCEYHNISLNNLLRLIYLNLGFSFHPDDMESFTTLKKSVKLM